MILTLIVTACLGFVQAIITALPTTSDLNLTSGLGPQIGGAARTINAWIPIGLAVECALVLLAIQAALFLFEFGVWVFHQFWGAS